MRFSLLAWVLVSLLSVSAVDRAAATVADDLCDPGDDPCVIGGVVTIDPGSVLTFGARTLQLAPGAKVSWTGDLAVHAASCDFQRGSTLAESAASSGDPILSLNCATSTLDGRIVARGAHILVHGEGPHVLSGQIKVAADQAGVFAVDSIAAPGYITVSGKIGVTSKAGTLPGEFRLNTTFGDITLTDKARIKLKALTADPFTEFFYLLAASGTVTVDGVIDARAKTGAYAFNFEGDQAVTFGPKSKLMAKAAGTGAEIAINSQSESVTLRGKIFAQTKFITSDGPRVRVCAGEDILVDAKASIDASTGGADGSIVLGAFDTARVGTVSRGARLLARTDGDIEVCGGTSGSISGSSVVIPDPEAVGTGVCLSPESGVIFLLDCNAP